MIHLLKPNEMKDLFDRISDEYEMFGAVDFHGDVVFDHIKAFSDVSGKRSSYAPKEFLIGRTENVLELPRSDKRAVIGLKSCDLKGFYIMDLQILGKDPFYTSKRENTLFVNFVCTEPCSNGFCASFGGPFLDNYQMQIIKDGEEYYVMSSEKFEYLMSGFREANPDRINDIENEFFSKSEKLNVEGIENRMKWSSSLWNDFASKCISCGACNYSCPTCYCFDVFDENDERKREWDSCILGGFAKMAVDNIRPNLSDRLRQRFYHKFKYYKLSRGEYLCTGCNRCTEDCPVDIEIKDVIKHDYAK